MDGPAFDRSDEEITYMDTTENVIYLAGGCFWGMEQLMQSIPGVIDAESGYANGTCEADADYKTVCKGETGFRETVRVEYDPEQVSLDALLLAYFYVIDPTVQNRQISATDNIPYLRRDVNTCLQKSSPSAFCSFDLPVLLCYTMLVLLSKRGGLCRSER